MRCIVATSDDGNIYVVSYNKQFRSFPVIVTSTADAYQTKCLSFNASGSLFAVGATDGIIRVFSTCGGRIFAGHPSVLCIGSKPTNVKTEFFKRSIPTIVQGPVHIADLHSHPGTILN